MQSRSFSRRRFARTAALLTGVATLSAPASPPAPEANEVEARLANIVRQYGSRLSPEQTKHLRKILADNHRMLESVRSFPLENGDTPASVLKLRAESSDPASKP